MTPPIRTRTLAKASGVLLLTFLILLIVGSVPRVRTNRSLAAAATRARTAIPSVYVIAPVQAPAATQSLAGTTQAFQDAVVYARTSGYLSRRYVDIGDYVKAGQLLAEIASPEVYQQLRQAEADYRQSRRALELQQATRDLAQITMTRFQAADAERAVAREAVDQSVGAHRTAHASVAAAAASVESNRANVRRMRELSAFQQVVSPFDGTVIRRNVDVGTLITAGSPLDNAGASAASGSAGGLFEIAQIDVIRVFVSVPQVVAPNIQVDMPVQVTVRGSLQQPVLGKVTRTASALDPATRTLLVEVDIPNHAHQLLPGTFVYVAFTVTPAGTRWRLPATALVFDENGTRVVTVDARNALHFQPVIVGRDFGDSFDIQAGLRGDERIVKQPTVSLREGQNVRPLASTPSGG
jgi:RND family efflux transporter MFP subunit